VDKSREAILDRVWQGRDVLDTIDPREPDLSNHVFHRFP